MQGLFKKYHIEKADGSPCAPDAEYFVLRLDTDPAALHALMIYADLILPMNTALAADLYAKIVACADLKPPVGFDHREDYTRYGRHRVIDNWGKRESIVDCPKCRRKGMTTLLDHHYQWAHRVIHGATHFPNGIAVPNNICFIPAKTRGTLPDV